MKSTTIAVALLFVGTNCVQIKNNNSFAQLRAQVKAEDEVAYINHIGKFGRSFASKEDYFNRLQTFLKTKAAVDAHNAQPGQLYKRGLNQFADWTKEEADKVLRSAKFEVPEGVSPSEVVGPAPSEDTVDWRNLYKGVRDQGQCGSCWTFASTGTIEGNYAKSHGGAPLADYASTQHFVDCIAGDQGGHGCNGGDPGWALKWAAVNGNAWDAEYPYKGEQGTCNKAVAVKKLTAPPTWIGKVAPFAQYKAMVTAGPQNAGIDANEAFMAYKSGIYTPSGCGQANHAVVAVGYGQEGSTFYWILRNSWSAGWGENGYVKVADDGSGDGCGVRSFTWQAFPAL